MRSESHSRRDHAEETILIVNESDEEDKSGDSDNDDDDDDDDDDDKLVASDGDDDDDDDDGDCAAIKRPMRASRPATLIKLVKHGRLEGNGPSRPPLLTDAYLSIETSHPPVSKNTPASEWHDPVRDMICTPYDREMTKTWYSAFKDTNLLQMLRGRIVTQLVIVGLLTNVDVLATAADAVRHGLGVWVVEDCLGYRSEAAHDLALSDMENDFAVERAKSTALMTAWEREKRKQEAALSAAGGGPRQMSLGATGMSKEELTKVVEGLRSVPGEPIQSPQRPQRQRQQQQPPPGPSKGVSGTSVVAAKKQGTGKTPDAKTPLSPSQDTGEKAPPLQKMGAAVEEEEEEGRRRGEETQPAQEEVAKKPVDPAPQNANKEAATTTTTTRGPAERTPPTPRNAANKEADKPTERTPPAPQNANKEAGKPTDRTPPNKETETKPAPAAAPQPTRPPAPRELRPIQQRVNRRPRKFESSAPVLGENDRIGEGDSFMVCNLLPNELVQSAFERVKEEVRWRTMFHRGGEVPRLVAVEGEVGEDGRYGSIHSSTLHLPPSCLNKISQFSHLPTPSRRVASATAVFRHCQSHQASGPEGAEASDKPRAHPALPGRQRLHL